MCRCLNRGRRNLTIPTEEQTRGEPDDLLRVTELIETHRDLGRSICWVLIAGITISVVSMAVLWFALPPSASPRRIAMHMLAWLWLGAYFAQWLWVAWRLARGESLTGNVQGTLRMGWARLLFLTAPFSFLKTVAHWRYLTQEIRKAQSQDAVQKYLATAPPRVMAWVAIAAILYLGGSVGLVSFLVLYQGSR